MNNDDLNKYSLLKIYLKSGLVLGIAGGFIPLVVLMILRCEIFFKDGYCNDKKLWIQEFSKHFLHFGWIGVSLMGITYYFLFKYWNTKVLGRYLPLSPAWLMVSGVILRGGFQPFSSNNTFATLVVLGGLLEFASIIVYSYTIITLLRTGKGKREKQEEFIIAGCFWFFIAGCLGVYSEVYMVQEGLKGISSVYESIIDQVVVFGFFISTVMGFSIKGVHELFGIKPVKDIIHGEILWLLTIGIILTIVHYMYDIQVLYILSATMKFFAVMAFIYTLKIFRKLDPSKILVGFTGFTKFMRMSYFWLTVFIFYDVINVYYSVISKKGVALMHKNMADQLVVEGFLTLLILGTSYRLLMEINLPIILRFKWIEKAFWAINFGIAGKTVVSFLYYFNKNLAELMLPVFQVLITVGITLFMIDMWRPEEKKGYIDFDTDKTGSQGIIQK